MARLGGLALCAALLLSCGAPAVGDGAAPAGEPRVRLKIQSAYPFAMPVLGEGVVYFRDTLDALPGHGIDLKVYDVDKLVKPLQIFDAVSAGKIDGGLSFSPYWLGKVPAAAIFGAVPFGPETRDQLGWLYQGGGLELWREIYARVNLVPVPCGALAPEASGWFRRPIERVEDLVGLKVRYAGLGGKVLEKLGASVTQIPAGDLFVSLERGVLDATEYSMPVVDRNLGFQKVAKHYYFPGWHQPSSTMELMINKEVWEGLSAGQHAAIEAACQATIVWQLARGVSVQAEALAAIEADGVTIHQWPPEILAAMRAANEELLAEMSAADSDFARALASQRAYLEAQAPWSEIAYPPKASAE